MQVSAEREAAPALRREGKRQGTKGTSDKDFASQVSYSSRTTTVREVHRGDACISRTITVRELYDRSETER